MRSYFERALELEKQGVSFVTVTLLSHRGHAPQDDGARILVTSQGLAWGTVGGGKVEAKAIEYAMELLQTKDKYFERLHWNLQTDVGMTCGGEVELLFENNSESSWRLFVFGAGHVGQSLAQILQHLNVAVTYYDSREEWLNRLPKTKNIQTKLYNPEDDLVSQISFDNKAFYVSVTQGHAFDVPILTSLLKRGMPDYIGVIGSPVKALKIRKELEQNGVLPEYIEKLHCPMGLPLGNNQPAEIAVSIIAQLLQCRDELSPVSD